jgi:hypothetical protein
MAPTFAKAIIVKTCPDCEAWGDSHILQTTVIRPSGSVTKYPGPAIVV